MNETMNTSRRRIHHGTHRDSRDGNGPFEVASHIVLGTNRLKWNDLYPFNKANIFDDR
jgi:hypothetical protein